MNTWENMEIVAKIWAQKEKNCRKYIIFSLFQKFSQGMAIVSKKLS